MIRVVVYNRVSESITMNPLTGSLCVSSSGARNFYNVILPFGSTLRTHTLLKSAYFAKRNVIELLGVKI